MDEERGETSQSSVVDLPFKALEKNVFHMKVKRGSKMRNILKFAVKHFENADVNHMVFTASGDAMLKNISCVEIMKEQFQNLYQINKLKCEGPDNTPTMHVLLSKLPLDEAEPGYQPPGRTNGFWKPRVEPTLKQRSKIIRCLRVRRKQGEFKSKFEKGDKTKKRKKKQKSPAKTTKKKTQI